MAHVDISSITSTTFALNWVLVVRLENPLLGHGGKWCFQIQLFLEAFNTPHIFLHNTQLITLSKEKDENCKKCTIYSSVCNAISKHLFFSATYSVVVRGANQRFCGSGSVVDSPLHYQLPRYLFIPLGFTFPKRLQQWLDNYHYIGQKQELIVSSHYYSQMFAIWFARVWS